MFVIIFFLIHYKIFLTLILNNNSLKIHEEQKLSFTDVIYLGNGIFEIIPFSNIELDLPQFDELMEFIQGHGFDQNVGLLINRKNPYSNSFRLLKRFGDINTIKATAIVARTNRSRMVFNILKTMRNPMNIPLNMFTKRGKAIEWLKRTINE
jgi:hypothetical protein